MKRFISNVLAAILMLAMMVMLIVSGCSGMQATKAMETTISNNAAIASVQLNTVQTVETAKQGMAENVVKFKVYYNAATINIFAYWFDSEKQIYCTARYYKLLGKNDMASRIFLSNTMAGSYTDDIVKGLFIEECKWMQQINDAVAGSGIQR